MNLRQITSRGPSNPSDREGEPPNIERYLTLLVEGAALAVPEVDGDLYKEFRGHVTMLALQLPDRLPDAEKLAQIRGVLREFDSYRNRIEAELRNRTTEWRALVVVSLYGIAEDLWASIFPLPTPNPSCIRSPV